MATHPGSFRLFRVAGIDVFLHWLWFVIAVFEMTGKDGRYSSLAWNALEYCTLFLIVLLHEFGHAFACRSVGGVAKKIVLWPLGGIAYVIPPQRPGPSLWVAAAGPLVNLVLAPALFGLVLVATSLGWKETRPDLDHYVFAVFVINLGLLVFNVLPIFPLDGGQMLRAFLWFFVGPAKSLKAVASFGFIGVLGVFALAVALGSVWIGVVGFFILMSCMGGLNHARALARTADAPVRETHRCPECRNPPAVGPFWTCTTCAKAFDTFETGAVCPNCFVRYSTTQCLVCGEARPIAEWGGPVDSGGPAT
jgi:Zn-dependent protease